jgi:hypothetical protein
MPENALDDFELRVRRTPCYGPCPVYHVQVDSKGRLRAKRLGTGPLVVGRRLSKDELSGLAKAFHEVGFFEMKSEYPADATDAPTTILELRSGGRSKRVAHDASNRAAPRGLIELEKYVEEITGARAYGFPVPTPIR